MGIPVILTPQAQEDLQQIVSFIARDNPERAISFGNQLIDKALSLSSVSLRGRVMPELNDPEVREIVHGSYRIIYEVISEKIYILRFWHGARGEPEIKKETGT
jgi:plasmid stabilization system protein ParE